MKASPGDRVVSLRATVHTQSQDSRLVLYAGAGESPYFDIQGKDGLGHVLVASPGTVAGSKGGDPLPETAGAQSSSTAGTLSNPPQIDGGTVDMTGKVVTAVFFQPGTQTISSFYVQEPTTGGNGIKIVPQQPCTVVVGDTVHIIGTVVASSPTVAECYIQAATVDRVGYREIPKPAGMPQRNAASGVFGLQQALYSDTTITPAVQGSGLSTVGTRVKVWGKVTWRSLDGTVCFIDDGSGLKSGYEGQIRTGIRVIWLQESPSAYQVNDYVSGITGVLGAELSEDDPALPVPVVRVHSGAQGKIIRVKLDSPGPVFDGKTWQTAYHSVQQAINSAASGDEVWVAAGTYTETAAITMKTSVAVYGGFIGTGAEVAREHRDWAFNRTIMDGGRQHGVLIMNNLTGCVIDGFTIQNGTGMSGAIYCEGTIDSTIRNNIIRRNSAEYGGGGLFAWNSTLTVVGNVFVDNTGGIVGGGGIYYDNTGGEITNNTIIHNTATDGGGIYISGDAPDITNNIVAFNSSGIYLSGTNPALNNNDVYLNLGDTEGSYWIPESDPGPDANGNIIKDPRFFDIDNDDFHIMWDSPCRDAGLDTVEMLGEFDIYRGARRNGPIDIGANETTECWRYQFTLTSEVLSAPIGDQVKVTAYVFDAVDGQDEDNYQVDISIDAGEIVSVIRNGNVEELDPGTQSIQRLTGTDGKVVIYVARQDEGPVHVNGTIMECNEPFGKTARIQFYDPNVPVPVVFLIDVTGSTGGGSTIIQHTVETVDYLYQQLQAQGRQLRVAGIKFGDSILDTIQPTSDTTAFKQWLQNGASTGGNDRNENSLEALKRASELAPGCYIALATDAGFHYWTDPYDPNSQDCYNYQNCQKTTLTANQVMTLLTNADCKVYIDPGSVNGEDPTAIGDYINASLYVNGAMEDTSYGTYTFLKLRAAITQ